MTRLLRLRRVTSVTRTHLIYHLISLTLLSACVGITAVLARDGGGERGGEACAFLPHELDARYAVLSVCLHSALLLAAVAVAGVCCCLRGAAGKEAEALALAADADAMAGGAAGGRRMRLGGLASLSGRRRRGQHKNHALFTSSSDLSSALSDFSSVSVSGTLSHPRGGGAVTKTFWNYVNAHGAHPARSNPSTLGKDDPPSITFLNGLPPGYPSDTLEKALGPYSAESTLGRPGPLSPLSPLSALRSLDNSLEHRFVTRGLRGPCSVC